MTTAEAVAFYALLAVLSLALAYLVAAEVRECRRRK